MTTRLTPRAVKPRGEFMLGCREAELTAIQPADAVEFFHKQKIKGTHAEIEAACAPYGYHPLSLRLLAGRILKDFENAADIVVAQKLKIDGDIIQQKHHVLEVSYDSLPPHEGKLLSTIACFRSPVELKTLQSIAENKDSLNDYLHDLVERGLLHFDEKNKKFDLHPIVRRYAYERLNALDRTAVHIRLRDYFAAVDVPAKPQALDDLAPIIELYHHMVRAQQFDEAREIFHDRLSKPLYFQFGAYQTDIELLRALFFDGEHKPPRLKDESAQVVTLSALASAYSMSGQPRRAMPLLEESIQISKRIKDKRKESTVLGNLANGCLERGSLADAEKYLRRVFDLCIEREQARRTYDSEIDRAIGLLGGSQLEYLDHQSDQIYYEIKYDEAGGHQNLGRILSYRGMWQNAENELDLSFNYDTKQNDHQGLSLGWSYYALRFILMARANTQSKAANLKSAIESAARALESVSVQAEDIPVPRDYIRAYWLLGAAYRAKGDLTNAEGNLVKAISMCRQINMVDHEANILLDMACLRYDQKNYEEAKSLAEEALLITERCGYVLQGADVNLFLAQYALEQEQNKVKAKACAETALKLAYCDGPPYYYKVAYDEAEMMLEKL